MAAATYTMSVDPIDIELLTDMTAANRDRPHSNLAEYCLELYEALRNPIFLLLLAIDYRGISQSVETLAVSRGDPDVS